MKIAVLGAGVLGVTTAYELARRGHAVTVFERQSAPARECSFANGGQLSYTHAEPWANPTVFPKLWKWMFQEDAPLVLRFSSDPHMIRWGLLFLRNCLPSRARAHTEVMMRLGLYSRQKMAELMADTGVEFAHLSKGTLHIFDDQKSFDGARRQADFQEQFGGHEVALTQAGCVALEPTLAHAQKEILGGMHAPMDASGDVHAFTVGLAEHIAARYGVMFEYNTTIRRLHANAQGISHLEIAGETPSYRGGFDRYVLCEGAHTPLHLRNLGLHVPIYPMKGYSISFAASEHCPQVTVTDDAARQVYTTLGGTMRVAGTAEFAGYNEAVREVRIAPLKRGMRQIFPLAPMENLTEWACLRPSTPDGPPILGATPLPNLWINSGHGTLGWTQAAGSARLMADALEGIPTEVPMTGLDFERNLLRF